jgi:DNA mismatch repair protein MutL
MIRHNIHILTPLVANQIAAGEVVERPASVVKELIENSLDAGSTRIQIEIEQGGTKLIQVRDDGRGVLKDDLALALSRHATSKINDVSDLSAITSLGFRGEALASICSVSRLTLTSCVAGASQAWMVSSDGDGKIQPVGPASHPVGTTVLVRDLFFNTPARRKFLRIERTEYQHIEDVVRQFILSRFDVGFVLRHQQRLILNVRAADDDVAQQQRVAMIMGNEFMKDAKTVQRTSTDMALQGWLGGEGSARSSTDRQFFYVNGRIVRDKLILHAMRQAYETLLPEGRHPMYVLFLEVPADKVDVNVHPTKHEVRFHESRQVHDLIVATVSEALTKTVAKQEVVSAAKLEVKETMMSYAAPAAPILTQSLSRPFNPMSSQSGHASLSTFRLREEKLSPWGEALGLLGSQYALAATAEKLHVIQLTLAKRHISYHRLVSVLAGSTIKAQPLLLPQTLDMAHCDYNLLMAGIKRLRKLMLEIDTLGPSTIVIRKIPSMLQECRFSDSLPAALLQENLQDAIVTLCQHVHHTQTSFNKEDMRQLLMDLAPINLKEQTKWFAMPLLTYPVSEFGKQFVL